MSKGCSEYLWKQAAIKAAQEVGVDPVPVMAGVKGRRHSLARWLAWRDLHARGLSYASIGSASGFNHTSVMHAVTWSEGKPPYQYVRRAA